MEETVVFLIQPVIKAIKQLFLSYDNTLNFVYDPQLSYQTAIQEYRTTRKEFSDSTDRMFPLFAYNRSALGFSEIMNAKSMLHPAALNRDKEVGIADKYYAVYGEFDFRFMYIHQGFEEIETFEILYTAMRGLPQYRAVNILTSLGTFRFDLRWQPLEQELQVSKDSTYHKSCSGSCKVGGAYLIKESVYKIIKIINFTVGVDETDIYS